MAIDCDVILKWGATPEQLRALGGALWRWCHRAAGDTGTYQYLDNQALADLIAGQLPAPVRTARQAALPRVQFRVGGDASRDCQATIESLRREIPHEGVEGVLVGGSGWGRADQHPAPGPIPEAV